MHTEGRGQVGPLSMYTTQGQKGGNFQVIYVLWWVFGIQIVYLTGLLPCLRTYKARMPNADKVHTAYRGGRGVKNAPKTAYILKERPHTAKGKGIMIILPKFVDSTHWSYL